MQYLYYDCFGSSSTGWAVLLYWLSAAECGAVNGSGLEYDGGIWRLTRENLVVVDMWTDAGNGGGAVVARHTQ